ncbi:MAG: hypothetical protein ACRD2D_14285, partial [Terriglobales bacterium]
RRTGTYPLPTREDRAALILDYFQRLIREGMPGSLGKMKQFTSWFTHGVEDGGSLRKAVYVARTEAEALERVAGFFAPESVHAAYSH